MNTNLTAVAKLVRSRKVWLGVLVFLTAALLVSFLIERAGPEEKPPATEGIWRNLTPGESGPKEVEESLGDPLSESQFDQFTVRTYPGDSSFSDQEIFFQDDQAVLIKERIDIPQAGQMDGLVAQYGEAAVSLYGPQSRAGFIYYAYFDQGVLFVANPIDGIVFEIWYFVPQGQAEFLAGPGTELSTQLDTEEPTVF